MALKCANCGALVNPETMVCEYCGARVEKKKLKKAKSKLGSTLGIAIAIIVVSAVVFVGIPLVCVFWLYDNHRDAMVYQEQEMLIDRLPQNGFDLVGVMGSCTTKGVTTIDYNDTTYRDGDTYVAFRDDERIITFETDMELEVDGWYTGYHYYSNDKFYSAVTSSCYESYAQLSYLCKEKATPTVECAISGKEVTVYKLRVGNNWYYCSKDTYDSVNVEDSLGDGYTFVLASPYVYKDR